MKPTPIPVQPERPQARGFVCEVCGGSNRRRLARTIKQWCEETGMGPTKTYEEIAAGRLKSRLVGRHRIILDDEGQEYLHSLPVD
jgi:hypothetical protein